jgi:hypothetical protein
MKNSKEKISGSFWLLVAILVCLESVRVGVGAPRNPGPGFLPFLAAVILGSLATTVIIRNILKRDKASGLSELWKGKNWIRAILVIVPLCLYPLLLPSLGYLIMTFALMAFLFGLLGRQKLWVQLTGAFVISVATYYVFHVLLEVQLPKGVFGF